jgi:hypothetical protein
MRCEKFHMTEGSSWSPGLHPHDLYELIRSSHEEAIEASNKL